MGVAGLESPNLGVNLDAAVSRVPLQVVLDSLADLTGAMVLPVMFHGRKVPQANLLPEGFGLAAVGTAVTWQSLLATVGVDEAADLVHWLDGSVEVVLRHADWDCEEAWLTGIPDLLARGGILE